MNLFLVGLDHSSAPIALRERLAFTTDEVHRALTLLTDVGGGPLQEAAILSTCNRVEVYGISAEPVQFEQFAHFLADFHEIPYEDIVPSLRLYQNEEAARHLYETAAGLHSIVLGEAQIQGQVRGAWQLAQESQTSGPYLNALFRFALTAGKRVRNETALGKGAASVSQAGVELARRLLGGLREKKVLLLGSGSMAELAVKNLQAYGVSDVKIANRTFANAQALAEQYKAQAIRYEDFASHLANVDIVISATSSQEPIISREMVVAALADRQAHEIQHQHPLLLIDLAVPRDIEASVVELSGVRLATVDDLQGLVNATLLQRQSELDPARAIVQEELDAFERWLREQETLPALTSLRQQAEELRQQEVQRAMRRLGELSDDQQQAIEILTQSLVNKLLHNPTLRLKHAAAAGEGSRYVEMMRDLFALDMH
jgi:glutamyl-tRNA reductase